MARALLGYVGTANEQALVAEVSRLRRRVNELETELRDVREGAHAELDLELHRIAEQAATPVLT